MKQAHIPRATAKRLPRIYRFLEHLQEAGKQRISSTALSEAVKVDAATIRRDFSYLGALGKKGYGYNVQYLLSFLRRILEQDDRTGVALVGVGNLGTALLHDNFHGSQTIQIQKAYDVDPAKTGTVIAGVPVYSMDHLRQNGLGESAIAILAVPSHAAQKTADLVIEAGAKGILNFTPARLDVPDDVRVHDVDLSIELHTLVYFLKHFPLPETE